MSMSAAVPTQRAPRSFLLLLMQHLYPAVLNLGLFGLPLALTWGRHIHQPLAVGLGVGFLANVIGSAAGASAPDHSDSPAARLVRAFTPPHDYRLK